MKKVLGLGLAMTMGVSLLAGCGGSADAPAKDSTPAAGAASETAISTGEDTEAAAANPENEEFVTLELYAVTMGGNNDSLPAVNEKLNEYLKDKINAEVHLNIISMGSYGQQVNLMMSSTEQVDLMMSTGALTTMLSAQGALTPLDQLLPEYGQGIVDTMGMDVINACMYNGEVFAVPTNRDLARSLGFFYRKDFNEQYELGLENATNLEELEASFAKLKEVNPDLTPVSSGVSDLGMELYNEAWDDLGQNGTDYGALENYGEELTVVNKYTSDAYKEMINMAYDWYGKGYIYNETDTTTTSGVDLFKTNKYLGFFANWNPSSNNAQSQAMGTDMGFVQLLEPMMSTATIQSATWTIPHNAKYPERAMQFLNLMYTDPTVFNLLAFGVEGENYVIVDEEKGIIDYPEGMDATTKTYDNTLDWMWGNMMIGYTWNGNDPELHEQMTAFNNSARKSKALGFVWDSSNVENQMTACSNVASRYVKGLQCGKLDPSTLDEFNKELEAAGINDIIADKQEQLDAWAQANGVQ